MALMVSLSQQLLAEARAGRREIEAADHAAAPAWAKTRSAREAWAAAQADPEKALAVLRALISDPRTPSETRRLTRRLVAQLSA
jgi:hypothetical protein